MSWTIKWNKKQTIWEWLCLNKFENIVFAIHINGNTEVKQILNGSRSVRPPYEATILSCWRWKFSISKCNWDCYCVHMFFFHSFRTFSVCVCVWLNAYVARARRLWSLWHHICMLLWASPYLCAFAFLWLEILLWFSCSLSLSLFLLLNSIGSCSNLGRCTSHNGSLTLYQAVFSTCIFRSLVFRFPGCAVLTHHFLAGDIKLFYGRPNVVVIEINACSLLLICLSTSLILSHRTFNLRLCFKQICAVFFFSSPLSLLLFTTFDPIGSCGYSRWIKRDEHDQDFVSAFY